MEEFLRENKESFDRLNPQEVMWERIQFELEQPSRKRKTWIMVAAMLIALIGIQQLFTMTNPVEKHLQSINLPNPKGIQTPLDPSLNKFTLVNFWASGDVLCSDLNCYYYLPAYEKYKDQGFEIYAVSVGSEHEQWISNIEENELPWIHVNDSLGLNSPTCIECEITKVPTSFLLDQKGRLVARNLDAESLDRTLEDLFRKD